jgi:hypothetical protein
MWIYVGYSIFFSEYGSRNQIEKILKNEFGYTHLISTLETDMNIAK